LLYCISKGYSFFSKFFQFTFAAKLKIELIMVDKLDDKLNDGMEELKLFYSQKKSEQEALRRLLDALEKKSKKENTDKKTKK
jgi:hypothetical protein